MCLIFCAYASVPRYRLLLVANRDERYDRASEPLQLWERETPIYAGKDLVGGGTWMGVSRVGRVAVLTNCRYPKVMPSTVESRGQLVTRYLSDTRPASVFIDEMRDEPLRYLGYSMLLLDEEGLYYYHSPSRQHLRLGAGVYGLSNAYLDTPWPKVREGKKAFAQQISHDPERDAAFFGVMQDTTPAPDYLLPSTGIPLERERVYSSRCIRSHDYGTLCTTLIRLSYSEDVTVSEQRYAVGKQQEALRQYSFQTTSSSVSL